MSMDEPEPIPTERVAPAISSPLLHERETEPVSVFESPPELEPAPELGVPAGVTAHPIWLVAAIVGVGATAASGDPRVGLALAGIVGLAGLIRTADRRLPFSFGEGFVGYRADLGWPRGVQEDDDVRWSVHTTGQPSGR